MEAWESSLFPFSVPNTWLNINAGVINSISKDMQQSRIKPAITEGAWKFSRI